MFTEITKKETYNGFCYAKKDAVPVYGRGVLPYKLFGKLVTPAGLFFPWFFSSSFLLARKHATNILVLYGYHWVERKYIFVSPNFFNKLAPLNTSSDF